MDEKMYLLDKFHNKYIIEGELVAESPICIGAGGNDFKPTATDNPIIRDEKGNPFIPGTSLKGVIRLFIERILSADIIEGLTSCNILIDKKQKNCICNEDIQNIKKDPEKYAKDKGYTDLDSSDKEKMISMLIYMGQCDVCKIFGGHGFGSKIKINDAKLIGDKAIIQRRDGVAIDRETLTALDGHKYDFECVAPGTRFNFSMTVDNLDDKHKKLLKVIINVLKNSEISVGGKTSVGLGNIKLNNMKICEIKDKDKLSKYYLNEINENEFKEELQCLDN